MIQELSTPALFLCCFLGRGGAGRGEGGQRRGGGEGERDLMALQCAEIAYTADSEFLFL